MTPRHREVVETEAGHRLATRVPREMISAGRIELLVKGAGGMLPLVEHHAAGVLLPPVNFSLA